MGLNIPLEETAQVSAPFTAGRKVGREGPSKVEKV